MAKKINHINENDLSFCFSCGIDCPALNSIMSKNLVPEAGKIYILNFERYITTWRLKEKLEDGAYIFFTSAGAVTKPVTLTRFQFVCRHNLIAILHQPAEIKPTDKLEIQVKRKQAYSSKEYSKDELDSLIDDIEDITF